MFDENNDSCGTCGWYWDFHCHCEDSSHYMEPRNETECCGDYVTRNMYMYENYGRWDIND